MTKFKNATPKEVIDYLVSYFETYSALPTSVIECQETGISYTAFGSNLNNKVEKAGGIRELLTSFVGRGAKRKAAPVKAEITARKKPAKKIAEVAPQEETAETIA